MRDEIDARIWAARQGRFSADLHSGFVKIAGLLARLNPVQWSAVRGGRPGQA